ncbi:PREDICTED: uncharacterized protein LOC104805428 isoform X2 [Tarenaya hassleriana]|uniref:uncharacterized protein LOC104805428 isoform X2 n=1 Tax=Tarenaya hassleriana TaxID=28532 RepID=UPI0008FD42EB|nr:PREDICTED: uncharacterized protein LOC104805428 isoform X2 [Tarenaya hassleriana]
MRRKEELKSGRRNRPEEGTLLPGTTCSLRKGHIASFLRAWMDVRPMMEVVKGAAFGILQGRWQHLTRKKMAAPPKLLSKVTSASIMDVFWLSLCMLTKKL